MRDIETQLAVCLKECESMPFLFVGSGISQRYIKTEPWEALLRLFANYANPGNNFAYELYKEAYRHSTDKPNEYLPQIASAIETDFNKIWYTTPEWKESREKNSELSRSVSPFKIAIADHFCGKHLNVVDNGAIHSEIQLLRSISEKSVSGVITTNYDTFMETIFNKFKVYVGQESLLFSGPQNVAEIYKIHGCCSYPDSIVINSLDYNTFQKRNAYLAAKLLTIFVEHPVVFLGYSLNDSDVEEILKSIIDCLSPANINRLQNRLIFVEYDETIKTPSISTHDKSFAGGKNIKMTKVTVKDFGSVYKAIMQNKAKYPTALLRKLKEDIYKLILTNDPKGRLFVKDFDNRQELGDEDIQYYAGVGVLRDLGYEIIPVEDIYKDIVFEDKNYDVKQIVDKTLPRLLRDHSYSVPFYKYIQGYEAEELPLAIRNNIKIEYDDFIPQGLKKKRALRRYHSIKDVLENEEFPKTIVEITVLVESELEIDSLSNFLKSILSKWPNILAVGSQQTVKTNLKRLIKIYDWIRYYRGK